MPTPAFCFAQIKFPTQVVKMSIRFSEHTIPLADIDMEDRSFRITTDADKPMAPLVASLSAVGLLSPPLLRPAKKNGFQVISGFRRLTALRHLGVVSASCRVVEGEADRLICQKLAVADNLCSRPLNLVEQALAVEKLFGLEKEMDRLCAVLSDLGMAANPTLVEKLRTLLSLPEPVLDHVARETIPLSSALLLAGMNGPDAQILAGVFANLRLGANKQREVAVLAREIAVREGISVADLFAQDKTLHGILNDTDADRGLQAARLRAFLEKRRFPALVQSRERYQELEKRLKLGRRVRLCPPSFFEGADFVLELTFSGMEEFRRHAALVNRLKEDRTLEAILSRSGDMDDV
ncbi:ParB/RepB/Spo0J family partition protein [Desulfosudis oleivorans]|nr:ParB N-terminal domain-containing protein [Desulfosudis oleivorans]